jgi:hypothetical protein
MYIHTYTQTCIYVKYRYINIICDYMACTYTHTHTYTHMHVSIAPIPPQLQRGTHIRDTYKGHIKGTHIYRHIQGTHI